MLNVMKIRSFFFWTSFVLNANYCTISTKYKTVLMLRNVLSEELASQSPDNHQNLNDPGDPDDPGPLPG